MSGDKKRVKVVINGQEYTIVGEKSAAHIQLVAETVNEQLEKLDELSIGLSAEQKAILVAVNAMSDQLDSHEQMIQLEEKIKNKQTD